jgi:suppressor for copper-sensitivity B
MALTLAIFMAGPALGQFDLSNLGGFGAKPKDPVSFSAQFTAATADQPAVVMVTALIEPGYHVYSITQPAGGPQRTELQLDPSPDYKLIGSWAAAQKYEPHVDPKSAWGNIEEQQHKKVVTWYAPVELAAGVDPAQLAIAGTIHLQACEVQCVDVDHEFTARLGKGVPIGPLDMTPPAEIVAPAPIPAPENNATKPGVVPPPGLAAPTATGPVYDLSKIRLAEAPGSLAWNLLLAFVGGLVLNLMPCVLPVIGLKVMSFVQQAGQSRSQALVLNLWYTLGILAVFWTLAGFAIFAGLSWGEQFGSSAFNIVMIGIVFAMALSMLGVWEIPIPGFVGGNTAHELGKKEGPVGAFLKGVVTTLLATPCTGPGMAVALGWAVRQPAVVTLLVFTTLGLGMALPYLVIGAFPQLVKFLPKPGAWMETFKQLMGFILLATAVWLMNVLPAELLLPTVALLTGIGFACWVFARTPGYAPLGDRLQTYALSAVLVAASAVFSYGWLATPQAAGANVVANSEWQPFTLANLGAATLGDRQTVLVDFSAEWCLTCKTLEKAVLHTTPIEEALAANNVTTMYGDFTHRPPEIKQTIQALRSSGVPVIAIFPGDDPYRPIVFRGAYTQGDLLEAIARASGKQVAVR